MDIISENTKTLGRLYHQFYQGLVDINLKESEWETFFNNKEKVNDVLGIDNLRFDMDVTGSRWSEPMETPQQDEDWDRVHKEINYEMSNLVIDWIERNGESGWDKFITFFQKRGEDFIHDIREYVVFHFSVKDETPDEETSDFIRDIESLLLLDSEEYEDHDWIDEDDGFKVLDHLFEELGLNEEGAPSDSEHDVQERSGINQTGETPEPNSNGELR